MVVTRRAAGVPAPPTSRSNSTQELARANKGKAAARSPLAKEGIYTNPSAVEANGSPNSTSEPTGPQFSDDAVFSDGSPKKPGNQQKSKHKSKKAMKKYRSQRRGSTSWPDLLARIFLFFFTIYSLSVCPNDTKLESPVCRGLSEYRRLILEPYVLPPIQNALAHPSIAPYINKAKPVYQRAVAVSTPVIRGTKRFWTARVVPQWRRHIVPQWRKHAAPRIRILQNKLAPYQARFWKEYDSYAGPAVRNVRKLAHQAQPHIIYGVAKIYDGYITSKPYAYKAYAQAQKLQPVIIQYIVRPFNQARRQFVDPHVLRMWEKVKEHGSGTTVAAPLATDNTFSASVSKVVDESTAFASSATSTALTSNSVSSTISASASLIASVSSAASPAALAASSFISHEVESAKSTVSLEFSATSSTISEVAGSVLPIASEITSSAISIAESQLSEAAEPVKSAISEVTEAAESLTLSSAIVEPSTAVESNISTEASLPPSVESIVSVPSSTPVSPVDTFDEAVDVDLEEFYADLGLDSEQFDSPVTAENTEAPSSFPVETEEQIAERQRLKALDTAQKRAEIEGRHTKWEAELQAKVKSQRKALRKWLVKTRKEAAAELKAHQGIRDAIENLHAETEKALRGTEAYFTKVKKDDKKDEAEKMKLWDRVVKKVEEKFEERVQSAGDIVNEWYEGVRVEENKEVEANALAVREVADIAQADIGLDYAWLDDVTYLDWQRYHGLQDEYKKYLDLAASIQNGSHPSPPINPVATALDDLQSELEDIVVGFETRLRRIKRAGERAFTSQDNEITLDFSDTEERMEVPEPPVVSILPVTDAEEKLAAVVEGSEDVSALLLGREGDEVVQAFERAGEAVEAVVPKEAGESAETSTSTAEPDLHPIETVHVHQEL